MAFRRAFRRFRARRPLRRFNRRRFRRTIRRRRPTPIVQLKVSQHATVTTSASAEQRFNASFIPSDYTEFNQMSQNFERYRLVRATVHVKPTFNDIEPVDAVAPYVIAPFHRPPDTASFSVAQVLSIDKHKWVAGFHSTRMSFIPAVQDPVSNYFFKKWIGTDAVGVDFAHHAGLIAWPASTAPVIYDVKFDLYFQFKSQKLNAL